jgi:hypothetical protein
LQRLLLRLYPQFQFLQQKRNARVKILCEVFTDGRAVDSSNLRLNLISLITPSTTRTMVSSPVSDVGRHEIIRRNWVHYRKDGTSSPIGDVSRHVVIRRNSVH